MHSIALSTTSSSFVNPNHPTVGIAPLHPTINLNRPILPRRTNPCSSSSISCNVALKTDPPSSATSPSDASEPARIGSRVRVTVPVKVYHIPKVDEFDLFNKEGTMKQYVGVWKGKKISANLPFKVEFVEEIEGRGLVKFVAHLKEDEFEYID